MHRESPSVRESCTGARVLPAGVVCHVPSVSRHFVVSPLPLSNGAKCLNNLSVLSNYHSFPKQVWCLVFSFFFLRVLVLRCGLLRRGSVGCRDCRGLLPLLRNALCVLLLLLLQAVGGLAVRPARLATAPEQRL